uniref:Uncharacterized protein n=1 Tax=Arion vulgaris TaxID=1028688 RepID=A0A0B7AIA0_9EUPU
MLQSPSFLAEVQFSDERKENSIHIDRHQILEILSVLTGEWVHSPVIGCESIHVCSHGPTDHLEERILHWEILIQTAQCVLEYVGLLCCSWGWF